MAKRRLKKKKYQVVRDFQTVHLREQARSGEVIELPAEVAKNGVLAGLLIEYVEPKEEEKEN